MPRVRISKKLKWWRWGESTSKGLQNTPEVSDNSNLFFCRRSPHWASNSGVSRLRLGTGGSRDSITSGTALESIQSSPGTAYGWHHMCPSAIPRKPIFCLPVLNIPQTTRTLLQLLRSDSLTARPHGITGRWPGEDDSLLANARVGEGEGEGYLFFKLISLFFKFQYN